MGYNRNREALANSQRPPTVEITALFALEELREGGYFFLFLRYVRIEQVAEMILQIMPITWAIRSNRFITVTTSLRRLYGERIDKTSEMSFALSVASKCPPLKGADCRLCILDRRAFACLPLYYNTVRLCLSSGVFVQQRNWLSICTYKRHTRPTCPTHKTSATAALSKKSPPARNKKTSPMSPPLLKSETNFRFLNGGDMGEVRGGSGRFGG